MQVTLLAVALAVSQPPPPPVVAGDRIAALERRVAELEARLAAYDKPPAPVRGVMPTDNNSDHRCPQCGLMVTTVHRVLADGSHTHLCPAHGEFTHGGATTAGRQVWSAPATNGLRGLRHTSQFQYGLSQSYSACSGPGCGTTGSAPAQRSGPLRRIFGR